MSIGPDRALLGRTIAGKFTIESFVGGGAMGAVYRARHVALDKAIALKVMHREFAVDPAFAARFGREAMAASRLDHPNSIRVLDFGEEPDGLVYIAMELAEGRDLSRLLQEEGPLDDRRIADIASQTLAALAVAHDMGVIHRDIKPENILVLRAADDEGRPVDVVKVCDFGIAKIADPRTGREAGAPRAASTATGQLLGTPEYMSPEHARGSPLDARADLYSLGVVLFRLLTGTLPFDAETAIGIAVKQIYEEPTQPSRLRSTVNPRLEAICLKALKKDPRDRYQSAREMRADLRALLDEGSWAPLASAVEGLPGAPERAETEAAPFSSRRAVVPSAGSEAPETRRSSSTPTLVASSSDGPRDPVALDAPAPAARGSGAAPRPPAQRSRAPSRIGWWGLTFLLGGGISALLFARVRAAPPEKSHVETPARGVVAASPGLAPGVESAPAAPDTAAAPAALLAMVPAAPASSDAGRGVGLGLSPAGAALPVDVRSELPLPSRAASGAIQSATVAPIAALPSSSASPAASSAQPAAVPPPAAPPAGAAEPEPPLAAPVAPAPAAPAPAAPAPAAPGDIDAAFVAVGAVSTTSGVAGVNVRSALAHVSFTSCYRAALRAAGSGAGGTANLHLAIDETGHVISATASGLDFLPGVRSCIEGAARGIQVRGVDTGDATADAVLTFSIK